jgi:hypothetical protein
MVHAVKLHGGRAVSYWNRWVLTDSTAKRLGTEPVPGPRYTGLDTAGLTATALRLLGQQHLDPRNVTSHDLS